MQFQPKSTLAAIALATALLTLPSYADGISISGDASYRERIALPPTAELQVQLVDVSLADAPSKVIASTLVSPACQVPIPFTLEFDAGAISDKATYALQARIENDGELLFITDTRHTLDPLAAAMPEHLALVSAAAAPPAEEPAVSEADAALFGDWKLVELDGKPTTEGVDSSLTISKDLSIGGGGGCNRFGGGITLEDKFDISNVFSTMMACEEPAMAQEQAFFAALEAATGYQIVDGDLNLEADGKVVARLTPAS